MTATTSVHKVVYARVDHSAMHWVASYSANKREDMYAQQDAVAEALSKLASDDDAASGGSDGVGDDDGDHTLSVSKVASEVASKVAYEVEVASEAGTRVASPSSAARKPLSKSGVLGRTVVAPPITERDSQREQRRERFGKAWRTWVSMDETASGS